MLSPQNAPSLPPSSCSHGTGAAPSLLPSPSSDVGNVAAGAAEPRFWFSPSRARQKGACKDGAELQGLCCGPTGQQQPRAVGPRLPLLREYFHSLILGAFFFFNFQQSPVFPPFPPCSEAFA